MKYLLTIAILWVLFGSTVVHGQTTTPSRSVTTSRVTPTTEPTTNPSAAEKEQNLMEQINNLKEKVASKVAELKLVEKRGVFMVVTQTAGNKITGTDLIGTTRFVDVDELTKFSSPSVKGTFGISDITKDMKLSVVGLYNKQSKRILARQINVVTMPLFISGTVTTIDKANFTVTIVTFDQKTMIIDIENVTRTSIYTSEDGVTRSGFSKLADGDTVYASGYPSIDQKDRMTATRIISFPELKKESAAELNTDERLSPTNAVTPTTTRRTTPTPRISGPTSSR